MKRFSLLLLTLMVLFAGISFADKTEAKAKGPIQDFSANHVTVSGKTFAINSSTEFKNGSSGDMAVGVMVEVEGKSVDGTLTAEEVEFQGNDDGKGNDKVREVGEVSSVDGDAFVVNGTTFNIVDETEFEDGVRGDLVPGVRVKVEGHRDGDTVIADEVDFMNNPGKEDDEIEIKGMVTAVSDDMFTVGGTEFNIVGNTRFIRMNRADLVIGIMVEVEGEEDGNGGYDAVKVKLEGNNGDDRGATAETSVLASVESVGDELLELILEDGTVMVVDEDTRLSGRHGLKTKAKDLIPGLTVRMQYKKSLTVSDGERREATHLNVLGNVAVKGILSGVATSAVEGSIMVGNAEVKYDKRTVVQGDTDAEDPAEIPDGQYVVALSNPLADGSFLANRIIVTDEDDDDEDDLGRKVKFYGTVSALSGGSTLEGFSVGEQFFAVNGDTKFKVKGCDEPFDPSLLAEGMSVKVIAAQEGSGGYIAVEVTVQLPIFKFTGPLDAYSTTALSILGVDMEITEYTEFKDVDPGDLGIGSYVEVKAVLWPDDSLIVCEIEAEEDDDEEFEVKGIISEKTVAGDDVLITVGSLTIVIEPGTDIRSKDMMLDVDDLAIGVEVQISGYINDTGDYIANIKIR